MLQVLQALHHPNVVSCKEAFVSGGKLCILMDYCSEGYCKPESSSCTAPACGSISLSLTSCLICGLVCNGLWQVIWQMPSRRGTGLFYLRQSC
jgi:serine/threonine protein kinase